MHTYIEIYVNNSCGISTLNLWFGLVEA